MTLYTEALAGIPPGPVEQRAAALYHLAAPCHPTWDQLGELTQQEWRNKVLAEDFGDLA